MLTLPPGPLSWEVAEGQMEMPACFAGEARLQPPPLKQKFYWEPGLPGSAEALICPRRTARGALPHVGLQGRARQGATARPSCPVAPGFPHGPPRRPQRTWSRQGRAIHPLLSPTTAVLLALASKWRPHGTQGQARNLQAPQGPKAGLGRHNGGLPSGGTRAAGARLSPGLMAAGPAQEPPGCEPPPCHSPILTVPRKAST